MKTITLKLTILFIATLLLVGCDSEKKDDINTTSIAEVIDVSIVTAKRVSSVYSDFNISIPMSTKMDPSTITNNTVTLSNASETVSGDVSYDTDTKTIIFDPSQDLTSGIYTVTLNKNLKSEAGYRIESDISWNIIANEYPDTPQVIGTLDMSGDGYGLDVSGNFAYVRNLKRLKIINISDPNNPTIEGYFNADGLLSGFAVSENLAYVIHMSEDFKSNKMQIIDVSDPKNPTMTVSIDIPANIYGITISRNLAFLTGYKSGLIIIDISDSSNPTIISSSIGTSWYIDTIAVSGDFAYLTYALDKYPDGNYEDAKMQIVDISDPSDPTLSGDIDTYWHATGITVSENFVYVTQYLSGLQIINISDPGNLTTVGNIKTQAIDIAVSGNYAYVSTYTPGLEIIDISDPSDPIITKSITSHGYAGDVSVSGNFAYLTDWELGLNIINIQMYK